MNCATTNGMKSGAEIIPSNLDREGVNDTGGLDADMDDALYCGDEVARVFKLAVCIVENDVVLFRWRDFVYVDECPFSTFLNKIVLSFQFNPIDLSLKTYI